jgi:hypothetical protein
MLAKWPLIKETRLQKIKSCLRCIYEHPFDRNKQKSCILQLYPGKSEKSVFRGMIIPSLRHLGLILGHAGQLRISANGILIINSEGISDEFHYRCISAVIHEIDKAKFGLLEYLGNNDNVEYSVVIEELISKNESMKMNQIKERVISWLSLLTEAKLIDNDKKYVKVNKEVVSKTLNDLDVSKIDISDFKNRLFDVYKRLARESAGIVDITNIRSEVVNSFLKDGMIITEGLFDCGLRRLPFVSEDYLISLGRPMGAEEKLFKYKGSYYRTLSIRILKGK